MNLKKFLDYLIKVGAFVIILEPFWMLLPFAGFFYGSLLNLEFLKNSSYTIWLLYFVFPVQTLMPLAIPLSIIGFSIFCIGAFQIYSAKIKKSGMVKSGLYRKLRHPQYTGLTLFCIGILLMWGRLISFILFFLMLFLYYLLARREEKRCLNQFGKEYEDYIKATYFLFPGDRIFSFLGAFLSSLIPNRPIKLAVSFSLLMTIGIGSCITIIAMRINSMKGIPFSHIEMTLADSKSSRHDLNVILIRGFIHHLMPANNSEEISPFSRALHAFAESERVKKALKEADLNKINTLLCFVLARTVQEKKPYYAEGKGDVFVMLLNAPRQLDGNSFTDYQKNWVVLGALRVNAFDLKEAGGGGDPVCGEIIPLKPFDHESSVNFRKRIEGVLNIYLTGLKKAILPINRLIERM